MRARLRSTSTAAAIEDMLGSPEMSNSTSPSRSHTAERFNCTFSATFAL
jgi:hypothetical protein